MVLERGNLEIVNKLLAELLIRDDITVKEVLKRMDAAGKKVLFVVDEHNRLLGSVTDGDIRRWILKEGSLQENVDKIYNRNAQVAHGVMDIDAVKDCMLRDNLRVVPVVDSDNVIIDVLLWEKVFSSKVLHKIVNLNIPVLIMAGGRGTRLDPFTKILPKPLIPFGDKPMVEIIMDQFAQFGCIDFYLTVNYKGKMVQSYFDNTDNGYNVNYIWEDVFLGTAGSIRLAMPSVCAPHIFISNCDVLIKADYEDIYNFHIQNDNDITLVGSMQHLFVPFGVLDVKNGGCLEGMVEKPEYDFMANTGMYLIKREVSELIPQNVPFDFTDLLKKTKSNGGKVKVYPISQQSWVDVGQWQEYHSALKKMGLDK